jgi:hypothetical protein
MASDASALARLVVKPVAPAKPPRPLNGIASDASALARVTALLTSCHSRTWPAKPAAAANGLAHGAARHVRRRHLVRRARMDDDSRVPETTGIYRGEVLAILGALADIRADILYTIRLLENDDEAEEEEEDS